MKVMVTPTEKRQLEQLLEIINNPNAIIAQRRLAKSKFDLIYERASRRSHRNTDLTEKQVKQTSRGGNYIAWMNKGEN